METQTQIRPLWVRVGLYGLAKRSNAFTFVWISLGLAGVGILVGFVKPLSFVGSIFIFSALWYWLAIRWVDKNGKWL